MDTRPSRPVAARRSWLFVPGADRAALEAAATCGTDVAIQELEDFTPPARRAEARAMCAEIIAAWRAAGVVATVRINPLDDGGGEDLAAAMAARPDAILLPKVAEPAHVAELAAAMTRLEREFGLAEGAIEIVPNIESARGLMRTHAIARASPRVCACLVASEDMAADLGAERGRDGAELAHVRARFHLECVAAGVVSIDGPYTWGDEAGLVVEARHARRLGYTAKSAVLAAHAAPINGVFTPEASEIAAARRLVAAFEAAREDGAAGVELDGNMVELPTYLVAKRLLARAAALDVGG